MGRDSVPVCVLSGNFGARRFALGEEVARICSLKVPPAPMASAAPRPDLAQMVTASSSYLYCFIGGNLKE